MADDTPLTAAELRQRLTDNKIEMLAIEYAGGMAKMNIVVRQLTQGLRCLAISQLAFASDKRDEAMEQLSDLTNRLDEIEGRIQSLAESADSIREKLREK
jgi:uncharacterized phage infection (PIP) family protein YhgE